MRESLSILSRDAPSLSLLCSLDFFPLCWILALCLAFLESSDLSPLQGAGYYPSHTKAGGGGRWASSCCGTVCLPARSKINSLGVVNAAHTLQPWFNLSPTLSLLFCLFVCCCFFMSILSEGVGWWSGKGWGYWNQTFTSEFCLPL